MTAYKNAILPLLFVLMFVVGGNDVVAKPYHYKNNYKIVDSCDEYMYGPKRYQGLCECYGDPYYYCAYFPDICPSRSNTNNTNIINTIQIYR